MTKAEQQAAPDAVALRNFIELEKLRREAEDLRRKLSKLTVKPLNINPTKSNG